ncbi:amidohydrolase [Lactobacillaceae bacterium Melli_B3]
MSITAAEHLTDNLIAIRHYLHQHPELSSAEFETTNYLKHQLLALGFRIVTPAALQTGVIAEIGPEDAEVTIGLRADIDALPIQEQTGLPFASVNYGVMHACGHDFHMTGLLGAAMLFAHHVDELKAKFRFIFQASEERYGGAKRVVKAGGIDGLAAIMGFHNKPDLKVGEISILYGGQMAAVDQFKVTLTGKGTHAAMPQLGVDPIVGLTSIVSALQTVVSRNVDPQMTSVLSVTHIDAGTTWNVLPESAMFEGTNRNFSTAGRKVAKQRFYEIVANQAKAFNLDAKIEWLTGPKVVLNDPKLTGFVIDETTKHAKFVKSAPSNAGEDFADYTDQIPSVFAFIGSDGNSDWHHPDLILNDEALNYIADWYYYSAIGCKMNY